MAYAMPLRNGMTATGSHEYFYSLRGAQPPGEGFFRSIGGADDNVKAFHNQDKTPAGDFSVAPGGGSYLKPY